MIVVGMRLAPALFGAVLATACGGTPSPEIVFVGTPQPTSVEVRGLPAGDLRALSGVSLTADAWQDIFAVHVGDASNAAMAGEYSVDGSVVRFTPMFGFDRGRSFSVRFDASKIPGAEAAETWRTPPLQQVVAVAAPPSAPSTEVRHVYPTGPTLPENMLRFYIEFSGPMGRGPALEHVRLLDQEGNEVLDPFLPVDAGLWSPDRTRFTLLFDPGRVKRDIKPNRDMGRALHAGRRYTLVIDRRWTDGSGLPLRSEHRHEFVAGPAVEAALDTAAWQIEPPRSGSRDSLVVRFPWPLDRALLARTLSVRHSGGELTGRVEVGEEERQWSFTPDQAWTAGEHTLEIAATLEDPAGNRIGRAFEVTSAPSEPSGPHHIAFRAR